MAPHDASRFVIPITASPIVEIDMEATAAYVRFRGTAVVRTEPFGSERGLIMLDFDTEGGVVGFEVVGLELGSSLASQNQSQRD